MQISHALTNPEKKPLALTIGNFDGVHIGHQAILKTLAQIAVQKGYHCAAMTFAPHAKIYFANHRDFLITDDETKAELIAPLGVQTLYQISFDQGFAKIPAHDFVKKLTGSLNVKYLLVGDDFRFGHNGAGDFQCLSTLGKAQGMTVEKAPTIKWEAIRVSSSQVRTTIKSADFSRAKVLLGRPFDFRGVVIHGRQLGRTIGFPTANIRLPDWRILPDGVFVVRIKRQGQQTDVYGMCNIGIKPTLENQPARLVEVHLLHFNGDLYHQILTIEPLVKIRDEIKFETLDELTQQLKKDKQFSLHYLKNAIENA